MCPHQWKRHVVQSEIRKFRAVKIYWCTLFCSTQGSWIVCMIRCNTQNMHWICASAKVDSINQTSYHCKMQLYQRIRNHLTIRAKGSKVANGILRPTIYQRNKVHYTVRAKGPNWLSAHIGQAEYQGKVDRLNIRAKGTKWPSQQKGPIDTE